MKTKTISYLIIALIICFYIMFGVVAMAQVDSTTIQNTLSTGMQIIEITGKQIIPNVPNSITGSVLTLIAGIIIRFIEKRKLRKAGKLNDR